MNDLRRWAMGLTMALATLICIVGFQIQTPAQTPTKPTLETAGLTLEKLADGIYTLIASTDFPPLDPATAICNGTFVIGSDGVLVVDPFQNEELANLLFDTVASLTDQPIRYVVNTHYHFDHSGGNAAAAALDLPLLGRGPIREFMLTRNLEQDPNATPPEVILNGNSELWLGDRQVKIAEFDGHSGGTDLILSIPDANVMIAGDLLFSQRIPYVGDGNIRVWEDTLTQLIADYPTARIVPGHGPVSDRNALITLRSYLKELENLALSWKARGISQEEAIAQTTVPAKYASYRFQGLFPGNLEAAYQQITLDNDSATAIQDYFLAQDPTLRAL